LPFEVASLVLLTALIGAVVISRQDSAQTQRQDVAAPSVDASTD
jgi:hypothetical protein